MQTYKFFEDPGHAWLEVPLRELIDLGVASAISHYSYIKTRLDTPFVYLEEDCDYAIFARAMAMAGKQFKYESIYQENTPIRNYANYRPLEWSSYKG